MNYLNAWQIYFSLWYFLKMVDTHQYKTLLLEDPNVCSAVTTRGVKFDPATAINLTLTRYNVHYLSWLSNFNCHFRLKPSGKYNGIIVVIQELTFRKDEYGECLDYVQFKTDKGRTSEKICGTINARTVMNSLYQSNFDTEVEQNTFVSSHGHLDVYIFISKDELRYDETTSISIAFTMYKHCIYALDHYKPCVKSREICINKNFFNDGIINCPFPDCVDEGGCSLDILVNNSVGNKVLIGSVTSLVLIFVIFILCLYICRKQRKLCWTEQFASPNTPEAQRARVIEMNESPNQSQTVNASAPAIDNQDQEDKDLPPSYESLFPSR